MSRVEDKRYGSRVEDNERYGSRVEDNERYGSRVEDYGIKYQE